MSPKNNVSLKSFFNGVGTGVSYFPNVFEDVILTRCPFFHFALSVGLSFDVDFLDPKVAKSRGLREQV